MKKIEVAPMFRRIMSAFMDGLFAFFMYFILITYVATPIAQKASKYEDYVLEIYQYDVASHLFVWMQQDDSSKYNPIEVKDFTEKLNNEYLQRIDEVRSVDDYTLDQRIAHLQYYYTVYLTADLSRVELPNNTETKTYDAIADKFVSPHYQDKIDGKLPSEIYTRVYFNTKIMGLAPEGEENKSEYFVYPIKDSVTDYEGLPVLKEGADEGAAKKYVNNLLYKATEEFYYSDYMSALQKNVRVIQLWTYIPTYIFVIGILYILIPLLMKNGATLGKATLNLGIVSNNGYKAKKRQILFRELVFVAEVSLSLFIIGIGLTSIATLGIGAVIMLVVILCNKMKKAPHDFAAMTLVVDTKTSVFFDDAREEEMKTKQVQENLDKLHSVEPENKNIIQVGSTIINEEIKQEIEQKRQEEKKKK